MPISNARVQIHALPDEDPTSALVRGLSEAAAHRWPPPPPPPGADVPLIAWYRLARWCWSREWRASNAVAEARNRGWWMTGIAFAVGSALGALLASAC